MLNAKEHLDSITKDKKEIRVEVVKDDNIVEISVYDSGEEPKDLKKIFEHGYSTKNKSSGYGLYYLKESVEKVGAELSFVPKPKYFRFSINSEKLIRG